MKHAIAVLLRPTLLLVVVAAAAAPRSAHGRVYALGDLLELARRQNPGLAAGAQATAGIEAQLREAERSWHPTGELLSLLAPAPEIRCRTDLPVPDGADPQAWREEHCDRTNVYDSTTLYDRSLNLRGLFTRTELRLTQPIYTFGKIAAGKQAAERGVQASRDREAGLRADLELNVRRAYYGFKLAREVLDTLSEGLEHVDEARKKIDAALKEGKDNVSPTDRLRLVVARSEVEARILQARRGKEVALGALRALIGPDAPAEIEIDAEPLGPVEVPARPVTHWEELALATRPEVRALDNFLASKQALADLEKRKQYPDIVLVGSATYAYTSSVDNPENAFFSDPYNTLSAGVAAALRVPLDLGVKNARAGRLRAEAEETAFRRREALGGIRFEVRRAHSELLEAQERAKAAQAGERAGRSWVTAIQQSFELGLAEMRDFADALSQYFLARIRHLEALHDGHVAAAALARATGTALP
jgi:outer membrane protein/S-layer protein transport system outer membrane protein